MYVKLRELGTTPRFSIEVVLVSIRIADVSTLERFRYLHDTPVHSTV